MRVKLGLKIAWREIGRIVQPKRVVQIRMNNEVVDNERLGLIVGMLFVWTGLFAISCIILAVTMPNSDFESVVAVVASALRQHRANIGRLWSIQYLGIYGNTIPVNHIDTDVVWKVGTDDSIITATP